MAKLRQYVPRLAAGAFILNSGLGKRGADAETAAGLHAMAAGTYPFLEDVDPQEFVKALSTAEIALGAALLVPFVPSGLVGLALSGFAGGLVGMYLRTPGMTQSDGVRPTPEGIGLAKDVFLLGIGGGLVADALTREK
ncbi:hypothetical protein CLV28_0131 [Sediminihabitans luteus]|uniref:DoxX-like protein n=1 Tax=Sediminihabitans luteus TaxID=1138585 RepID=A0A2M9CYB6_9CELL|nr:hypothetical protein [Sediminihabitans luteus]PJJ76919.1 hypothetical protein CLV28_0131 [Sediminihabitans luteus]GII99560.1 hypothetical protein Slu03_19380 [Sediminihabitans luteus]